MASGRIRKSHVLVVMFSRVSRIFLRLTSCFVASFRVFIGGGGGGRSTMKTHRGASLCRWLLLHSCIQSAPTFVLFRRAFGCLSMFPHSVRVQNRPLVPLESALSTRTVLPELSQLESSLMWKALLPYDIPFVQQLTWMSSNEWLIMAMSMLMRTMMMATWYRAKRNIPTLSTTEVAWLPPGKL